MEATQQREGVTAPANWPWKRLDDYVTLIRRMTPEKRIWKDMRVKPLTPRAIDALVSGGWKLIVTSDFTHEESIGSTLHREQEIHLEHSLIGYRRDKVLLHEIVHAHYGMQLYDGMLARAFGFGNACQNNAITDWIARKARAKHLLLRYVISSFGLKPSVYDATSYRAFGSREKVCRQWSSSVEDLEKVCMDGF